MTIDRERPSGGRVMYRVNAVGPLAGMLALVLAAASPLPARPDVEVAADAQAAPSGESVSTTGEANPSNAVTDLATAEEVLKPLRAFVGNWSGTRNETSGKVQVTREYGTTGDNRALKIMEKAKGRLRVWGLIKYDPTSHALVLEQLRPEGGSLRLGLDRSASSETRLVFTTADHDPEQTRVVLDRASWDEFSEHIERETQGGGVTLVSDARFKRKS